MAGGLIRSLGGWAAAKAMRGDVERIKGDERILGDGNFVQSVLENCRQELGAATDIRPGATILIGWWVKWRLF